MEPSYATGWKNLFVVVVVLQLQFMWVHGRFTNQAPTSTRASSADNELTAEPQWQSNTAIIEKLCRAVAYNELAQIRELKARLEPVDVDVTCPMMPSMLSGGSTPLTLASFLGHTDVVRELLADGADVNDRRHESGGTALISASYKNHTDVMRVLLKQDSIEINHTDTKTGRTALAWAAHRGHVAVVRLLLDAGADTESVDNTQQTAKQLASISISLPCRKLGWCSQEDKGWSTIAQTISSLKHSVATSAAAGPIQLALGTQEQSNAESRPATKADMLPIELLFLAIEGSQDNDRDNDRGLSVLSGKCNVSLAKEALARSGYLRGRPFNLTLYSEQPGSNFDGFRDLLNRGRTTPHQLVTTVRRHEQSLWNVRSIISDSWGRKSKTIERDCGNVVEFIEEAEEAAAGARKMRRKKKDRVRYPAIAHMEKTLKDKGFIGMERFNEKMSKVFRSFSDRKQRMDATVFASSNNCRNKGWVVTGAPGTGKTSVIRALAKHNVFHEAGLVAKGGSEGFFEVNKVELKGQYSNQANVKFQALLDRSRGGVVFIDEAYSYDGKNKYDRQILDALLKVRRA